jgi:4-hydroxy-tetrahydrodipicolinate synthase
MAITASNGSNGHSNGHTNGHSNGHSSDEAFGIDMRGFSPAAVTPFTEDMEVDYEAIDRIGKFFLGFPNIKSILVLGHAGEGTALTSEEKVSLIQAYVKATEGRIPIITGITSEGNYAAGIEARAAKAAGASAALIYPSQYVSWLLSSLRSITDFFSGWLRFGYQSGAPVGRHQQIWDASHLPQICFQYPQATKATLDLQTQLDILALPFVFALKNGVRDMKRWDTEVPVIRKACNKPILT